MTLNPRALAAKAVLQVIKGGESLTASLSNAQSKASPDDRSLVAQLSYGSLRFEPRLSLILSQVIEKPLRSKDLDIYSLLLLGCYELAELQRPAHAVVNEYTEIAPNKKRWAKGFINAVLRKVASQHSSLANQLSAQDRFTTAHPDWLVGMIKKAWPNRADNIFDANNTQAPMTLRVNLSHHTVNDAQSKLTEAGIASSQSPLCDTALVLDTPTDVHCIPGFSAGAFSVQDEAAQLASRLLPVGDNTKVLDACAAPGGKTCALLEQAQDIEVTAVDIDSKRLQRVQENLDRCGKQATLLCADISEYDFASDQLYDSILADVPCSATGVIRRHPDIKQLRQPDDIAALSTLQQKILANLWQALKSGGHLLYATCSTLPRENHKVIESFLNLHQDALLVPICLSNGVDTGAGWQLFAGDDLSHDGFFYALIKKQ